MSFKSAYASCAAAAAALCLSIPALAYEVTRCNGNALRWEDPHVDVVVGSHYSGPTTDYYYAINGALYQINRNPSRLRVYSISQPNTSLWMGNGVNEIVFTPIDFGGNGITLPTTSCSTGNFVEKDIFLNVDFAPTSTSYRIDDLTAFHPGWQEQFLETGSIPWGQHFASIVLHELGHLGGLKHESDTYNIMGDPTTHLHVSGIIAETYVGEDAADGLLAIYGAISPNVQDLSATSFRRTGSASGLSQHGAVTVRHPNYSLLGFRDNNDVPGVYVSAGGTYQVAFGLENNGRSDRSGVSVVYYVSTNSNITSSDIEVARGNNVTLNVNTVYYRNTTFTVPSNLQSGRTYYVGVRVDADDEFSEIDETNNTAYTPIRIW